MNYKQKHTNLPMNTLEKREQEGWYGYNNYYIDMDGYYSVLFDNFHNAYSRDFYESGYRMGPLHGQTHHHRDPAVRQPAATKASRCVPPLFPECILGTQASCGKC